jgi:hypothetical protein
MKHEQYTTPTHEEIQRITDRAHALRAAMIAQAGRDFSVWLNQHLASLRLSHKRSAQA